MSSGIAAPIGGRFFRARTLGHESAREHERTRLRRYLRVTTLQALENIAGTPAETEADTLIAMADDAATGLRTLAAKLADVKGGTAVASLQREVGAMVHDTALQALEYLACHGDGAGGARVPRRGRLRRRARRRHDPQGRFGRGNRDARPPAASRRARALRA